MPSPFPGMNPYLEHEDAWHNFHEQFPASVVAMLEPQVGPNYFVRVDERIYVHEVPEEPRRFLGLPDVAISERVSTEAEESAPAAGATAVAARHVRVLLPVVETVGLSYVEIRNRRDRRLVTVIELLSPSNKDPGADRNQYVAKRATVLASHTHLVELDLLRGGPRMPLASPLEGDYGILISRYSDRPRADWYPVGLREPLPTIPIPLASGEPEPRLDLQAILHQLYDSGGFRKFIYDADPVPPLRPDDAAWARDILARIGRAGATP